MTTYLRADDAVTILRIALVVERSHRRRGKILDALSAILGSPEGLPGVSGRAELVEAVIRACRGLSDEEWAVVQARAGRM